MFFRSRTQTGTAEPLLAEAFDEATPDLAPLGARPYEMVVLGGPARPGRRPAGGPGAAPRCRTSELTTAPLPDDICFYREYPQVPLTDLPQLGDAGAGGVSRRWAPTTRPTPAPTFPGSRRPEPCRSPRHGP